MVKSKWITELVVPMSMLTVYITILLNILVDSITTDKLELCDLSIVGSDLAISKDFFAYEEVVYRRLGSKYKFFRDFIACSEVAGYETCFAKFLGSARRELGLEIFQTDNMDMLSCLSKSQYKEPQLVSVLDIDRCLSNLDITTATANLGSPYKEQSPSHPYSTILIPIFMITLISQLFTLADGQDEAENDTSQTTVEKLVNSSPTTTRNTPKVICSKPSAVKDAKSEDIISCERTMDKNHKDPMLNNLPVNQKETSYTPHDNQGSFFKPVGRLILKVGDEEYDLKDKIDLERWKKGSTVKQENVPFTFSTSPVFFESVENDLNSLRTVSTTSTSSIAILTSAKARSANYIESVKEIEDGSKALRKARTDVNIKDPQRPIPTVLQHPKYGKKGERLKRIFIPGRGWVSSKVLESEKMNLYGLITNKIRTNRDAGGGGNE